MTPLVTVIIPCYNQAHYLPLALESALSQTHPNLEIIIVNDGSTDATSQVAHDYITRHPGRIRLIEHPNQGQARSRHAALAVATGDFLVQLDADDLLEPEMMSIALQAFAADPALDIAVGDAWLIAAAGRRLRPWPQHRIVPWPEVLRNNPYGALAAIMTRTAAVRQAGGLAVEGASGVEDWDLWARLARCGKKFAALGRPVASYRQSPASTSHKAVRMLQATVQLLDRCRAEDPRLSGLAIHPPLSDALYQELRNGKVFKSLGLALTGSADALVRSSSQEINEIIEYLIPGALDVRFTSDQFLEGIHYGFFLKMEQTLPSTLDSPAFLNTLEVALLSHSLAKHYPALRQAIQRTLANPLRKRSLLARLKERFFK